MSAAESQPGLQLPAPVPESQSGTAGQPVESAAAGPETAPAGPEQSAATGQTAQSAVPLIPLPTNPAVVTSDDVASTTQSSNPPVADDGDLIEKDWVNKAKRIVEANRNDPYRQSEELTTVKADYMQKRYNKTIKLNK